MERWKSSRITGILESHRRTVTTIAVALWITVFLGLIPAIAQEDLDKMQGTWRLVAMSVHGQTLPSDKVIEQQAELVISFQAYRIRRVDPDNMEEITDEGTISVDATKTPKTIDFIGGETDKGIYRFVNIGSNVKRLIICRPVQAGSDRPLDFDGESVFVYERKVYDLHSRGLSSSSSK